MSDSNLHLFRRSNGIWYILLTVDARRHWKSTGCRRESDALKKLAELKDLNKPKIRATQLLTFIDEFLAFARTTYAAKSVGIFVVALRNLRIITGDCRMASITPKHVDLYKSHRLGSV